VVELESETAGRVVLRVQDSAEGVRARIIASNDTGYRIIHSEMDNVRQVVEQSGIGLADLSLGQHGEGPQQESQSGNRADRRPVVTEPELQSELTNRFPADNGLNVLV
jgi:flagellar hook-length control protein FliK